MTYPHLPPAQGLYDPRFEHDSCGVGFICNSNGVRSREIVSRTLEVLRRLEHRSATGADPKTGDGAGILMQIPHSFFADAVTSCGFDLPNAGTYGTGLLFLPTGQSDRDRCKKILENAVRQQGHFILGWRSVPVDLSVIGETAKKSAPRFEQIFIRNARKGIDPLAFERDLYMIRKNAENAARGSRLSQESLFYITNLSSRTISYKGLLMPTQLEGFFTDLRSAKMESAICIVHSRYSTNTFPTWDLSQPFRFIAHNGEINTLRGNINWMRAREGLLSSGLFGPKLKKVYPIIVPGGSDSAALDNAFELLTLSGRSLAHAMMMLIPAAWELHSQMSKPLKDFYRYHSCLMEPWDGPAAVAFTDGTSVGAVLDRNGLRPARYLITKSGMVMMASEVGVLDIDPSEITVSGRLEPGKIFYIDTIRGEVVDDAKIKDGVAKHAPYGSWLKKEMVELAALPSKAARVNLKRTDTATLLKAFGYSREDLKIILKPMAETGQEPIGSMGNDTPHAVLSEHPQLIYSYFKQLFAQVTNPAIDPIREELVMSLESAIGPERNLLDESPKHCHRLWVRHPVLLDADLGKIKVLRTRGFKARTISTLYRPDKKGSFRKAIDRISAEAIDAIEKGFTFIILSDRGVNRENAPLPALLATGAVHHHLVRNALRTQIGIIVESGEPREVHHCALLFGYGADCVNPYLAYEAVRLLAREKEMPMDGKSAVANYRKAIEKGLLKILSKMGISTIQSYRGAQIFEALGLSREVVDLAFTGTPTRIGGATLDTLATETLKRHNHAFPERPVGDTPLKSGGLYQWRKDGEFHLWNPESIAALQDAVWQKDYEKYRAFARLINDQSGHLCTLRGALRFKKRDPISIDEVEPAGVILTRFATGAMSFGSISKETHESLAIAMNALGGRSNTGEGGEDPARFTPLPSGESKRSSIKQVASGRFGVTTNYLVNADELQIKIAQGAKPGEGGQLPGHKVSADIARTRYTTPGVTLISPPPHHDIYSIEDLAQLIFDLKNTNPTARISVKLVSEVGVGTVAAGVAKAHADMILISGGDGGTGASPLSSIKHAGLPWELGLSETHQTLVLNDLRSRVRLQTDGQMRTGRDVAIAALLGAEEFGFCTAALIVLGCVMLRHCHLNNCSVGVATQDAELRKRFRGNPEFVVTYFHYVAEELREIMANLGLRSIDELVGRTDLLEPNTEILTGKNASIDFSKILFKPDVSRTTSIRCSRSQDHGISAILDLTLIKKARRALDKREAVTIRLPIKNTNRAAGAMLSGAVCKRYGEEGLPVDTIRCYFSGYAGQSFGAFLAKGVTFELEGMANDYVGKGISGGKIIIYPDKRSTYASDKNVAIGNTAFYGAICGTAYIRGVAGERFCIRNSGLEAVVEGVGDHGCEYMTGGTIVVLGATGRNFGAGMSGGIAYCLDRTGDFSSKCNHEMVSLDPMTREDFETVKRMISEHAKMTASPIARALLEDFNKMRKKFVKVMPMEYKRILQNSKASMKKALQEVSDG